MLRGTMTETNRVEGVPTSVVDNTSLIKTDHMMEQQQQASHLPSKECVLFTAKICFMVATFTEAEKFAALPEQPFASFDSNMMAASESQVSTAYTDSLVELSIRDCASSLVFEGFFTGESHENGRAEVSIFRTLVHQRIIVCYKDTNKLQAKPVKKNDKTKPSKKPADIMNDVYPDFLKSYQCLGEESVFEFIDNMLKTYPSYSLLFTGHSFGASLGSIAAVRYATTFPDVHVSCHVFGSPRPAGSTFQTYANNLPNLKVIRFEKSGDPYVFLPSQHMPIGRSVIIGLDGDLSKLKRHFFKRKHNRTSKNDLNTYIKAIEQCDFICW